MSGSEPGKKKEKSRIFHVGGRENLQRLRDDILRINGFEVDSTLSDACALEAVARVKYDLVLIDVEGNNRVPHAVQLCDEIKKAVPHQPVAYVCNHWVAIESDCPDDIIRAEFNPEALVRSVKQILGG